MSINQIKEKEQEVNLLWSLALALFGVGLIGLSVYLGTQNNALATLIQQGGSLADYLYGFGVLLSFAVGVYLIGRHIAKEGVAEHFCEQTPY